MSITVSEILKNRYFLDAKLPAGDGGIDNIVKRVSVFDCPCHESIMADGIVERGDMFISCLEQFKQSPELITEFVKHLAKYGCAALCVVSTGWVEGITQEMLDCCRENNMPLILLTQNLSYATIIGEINHFMSADSINELNRRKIDRIQLEKLASDEQLELLRSIAPDIQNSIQVVKVYGNFRSTISSLELWRTYNSNYQDILLNGNVLTIILSNADRKKLANKTNSVLSHLKDNIITPRIGLSRIHSLHKVVTALSESEQALRMAKISGTEEQLYDALSPAQMFTSLYENPAAKEFQRIFIDTVADCFSADILPEILSTIHTFVSTGGDYRLTSELMGQHVNTIRYRINRVKSALDLEDNQVLFYEVIAIESQLYALDSL